MAVQDLVGRASLGGSPRRAIDQTPAHRIAVIRNGVNPDFYMPDHAQKSPTPLVVYVGRLVPDKDPLTLVEGFRLTTERVPEARFELIGDGHLKGRVERFIEQHGLSGHG